jgi:hypothetical protein
MVGGSEVTKGVCAATAGAGPGAELVADPGVGGESGPSGMRPAKPPRLVEANGSNTTFVPNWFVKIATKLVSIRLTKPTCDPKALLNPKPLLTPTPPPMPLAIGVVT